MIKGMMQMHRRGSTFGFASWLQFAMISSALMSLSFAQPFEKKYLGCARGEEDGPSCAKQWEFTGGPGYVGQRTEHETKIICSPSCTDVNNPKICSLILALHGIYSNPGDQEWLMLGYGGGDTYDESEENGGPFCISFHKSEGDPWDYSCDYNDAAHIEGFILWALGEFPIDPNAVFLHGFSSGAIMTSTLMFSSCKVERLVSAAAPYAGLVNAAPTTKAAFLVIHGTHDDVVPYREDWIDSIAIPSCECKFPAGSCFNDNNYIDIKGPTLAASVAILRGYDGAIFDNYPAISDRLDLVNEDRCQEYIDACYNPYVTPNPFNEGFDCNTRHIKETDVIEFPTTEDSGPVVLWSINIHNHDYPNKRRSNGPTEVFFQMRSFFNKNRGRYPNTEHGMEEGSPETICSNPSNFHGHVPPEKFFRNDVFPGVEPRMTPSRCKEYCERDFRCTDAFYVDYTGYGYTKGCKLFYEPYPCLQVGYGPGVGAIHFKAKEIKPTPSPSNPLPTPSPSNPLPTPSPTDGPTASPATEEEKTFCEDNEVLEGDNPAGYSCLVNGESIGDSNDDFTKEKCDSNNGDWVLYNCDTALAFYKTAPLDWLEGLAGWWRPKCCKGTPEEKTFCEDNEVLEGDNPAGYSCLVDGESIGDSNDDFTKQKCDSNNGDWVLYNCDTALAFYKTAPLDWLEGLAGWWRPKCCVQGSPTVSPTTSSTFDAGCPKKCAVPICIWLGTDGPGWQDDWERDDDGVPTENGFCTQYCQVYDDETGAALCGNGDWHKSGTDCTGCTSIAEDPIIPGDDREESSGLCAAIEEMSGHALWGTGIKECGNGQDPTNESRCTVWQSMNGDATINPERTCRGFCSSFGLQCENGYDDGNNSCLYGGDGIGCDNILGNGSDGGPTPDHVCVCVNPSPMPSSNPSLAPTESTSSTPSMIPTMLPSNAPTVSTSSTPSMIPTMLPSNAQCADGEGRFYWKTKKNKDILKTCKWLKNTAKGKQRKNACNKKEGKDEFPPAKELCLETCDKCPKECADGEGKFYWKTDSKTKKDIVKTCNWLKNTAKEKQRKNACNRKVGKDEFPPAKELCLETCNKCP